MKSTILAIALSLCSGAYAQSIIHADNGGGPDSIRTSTGGGNHIKKTSEPPSSFVCRLAPAELATSYSNLDQISVWNADTASSKGAECNQVQATSTYQPVFYASCAEFDGQPCADFNGADNWLHGATSPWTSGVSFPFSMCGIAMRSSTGTRAIFGSSVSGQYTYFAYSPTTSKMIYFDFTPIGVVDNYTPLSNTSFGVGDSFCLSFNAVGDGTLYLNNTDIVTGDLLGHTRDFTGLALGTSGTGGPPPGGLLDGRIAELIVYDREIATETVTWFNYSCATYGLGC